MAFALALVGHLGFLALMLMLSRVHFGEDRRRKGPPQQVALRPLAADQWNRNRGTSDRTTPAADGKMAEAAKKKAERKEPVPKGQVVAVPPGNGEEAPDAKYLAERDNRTKKETKAKEQSPFYRNAMPNRTTTEKPVDEPGTDPVEQPLISGNQGVGDDDRPAQQGGETQHAMEIPDVQPKQEIALKDPADGAGPGAPVANRAGADAVKGNSKRLRIQEGGAEGGDQSASPGRKGIPGIAHLMPSQAALDKIAGAAPNDRLSNVEEGDGTYLNTKEWKYSSFFNRVKQSVGMHWDPGTKLRTRDPTGNIYGGRDRYTVVNVTLDSRGMLKDVYVEKSCGVDFLDLEAMASFERAQPFPNPPPGLAGDGTNVRFTFGFYLELGSAPRMRLFRQAN
jgi:TonB family protein